MIKKSLLLISFIFILKASSFGQACTPDPQYTKSGVHPDSAQNFDTAYVASSYSQLITVVIPKDTVVFITLPWDSTRMDSVTGLPNSMSYTCWNSFNNSRCSWKGNTKGCAIITGTPTTAEIGTHHLKFYTSNFVGGNPTPNGYTITYYKIIVMPASNGVNENPKTETLLQNNPNPFYDKTEISFSTEDNGTAQLKIYNLIGSVVQQSDVKVRKGMNKIEVDAKNLDSGIYFYSVIYGNNTITHKMVVNK
ncbi:MAG: T9SS type A sorting domain-containing protein [Bacteroidia bacterium]